MRPLLLGCSFLALCFCACNSTAPGKGSGKPAVVPLSELPQRQRQVLADYGRGGEAWELRREEVLADPALARFLVDNLVVELVRSYQGLTAADPRRAQAAFDRARAELVRAEAHAIPVLAQLLETGDSVVAHVAGDVLARIGREAIPAVLPVLASKRFQSRQRAVAVLGGLPAAGPDEDSVRQTLAALLTGDPEWMVRAQAAVAMGDRGSRDRETRPWRQALEKGLRDADPAVSESSAFALQRLGDPAAVPALVAALERKVQAGDLPGVTHMQQVLSALTGQRRDLDLPGWKRWWEQNRDAIEGPKAVAPRGGGPG